MLCGLPEQAPLADLYAPSEAPTAGRLAEPLGMLREAWAARGGERSLDSPDLRCVLPLPGIGMWPWQVHKALFARAFPALADSAVQLFCSVTSVARRGGFAG